MNFVFVWNTTSHNLLSELLIRAASITALCLILVAPGITQSPSRTAPESRPPLIEQGIQVRLEATPKTATVGDPIRMDLDVTMPSGYHAELPALDKQIGDFSILEFAPGTAATGSEKPQSLTHYHARIVAAVYKTGAFTFSPVELRLRTPKGKQIVVSSPAVKIEIKSVLAGNDPNLRDLKKQVDIPERFRWLLWLAILAALVAAAILGWIFWKRRRAQKSPIPAIPPGDLIDIAEAELRDLLARGLPEGGKVKPFYVLLSEIVRKILEAGFGIHTAEKTTSEIVDRLRRGPGAGPENMERIESFLLRCDIVKFAKYIPSNDEHASAAEDALWILECSRKIVDGRQSAVGSRVENT